MRGTDVIYNVGTPETIRRTWGEAIDEHRAAADLRCVDRRTGGARAAG